MATTTGLPNRRLVLNLYKSLLSMAVKYDKNIPSHRNPLFLVQREKDVATPNPSATENHLVWGLVREPFRSTKNITDNSQIQVLISEAFKNLRMLNQFYQPSLVWINELGKDQLSFENILMAIAKFDNAELNQETLTSQLEAMSQRVNALAPPSSAQEVASDEVAVELSEAEAERVNGTLKAIAKVIFYENGFTSSVSRQGQKEAHVLPGMIAQKQGSPPLLASLILALAQRRGLNLYASSCNGTFLRYSVFGESRLFHDDDIFIDVTNGKIFGGIKLVTTYARNANIISSSPSSSLPLEHNDNLTLVSKMITNLAGHSSKWKEHLTIIHELTRNVEPQVTTKPKSSKSKVSSKESEKEREDKKAQAEQSSPPSSSPSSSGSPSSSSPSSSPSSATATSSSASSSATSASSSSSSETSSPYSPSKYFSSFFSFLRRKPKQEETKEEPKRKTEEKKTEYEGNAGRKEGGKQGEKEGEEGKKKDKPRKHSRLWSNSEQVFSRIPGARRF